ncbi:hypothetical protein FIBSPDRAFT_191751 [Athelia psychrophila]|uniref:Uncharacterized protein n=1 Tax=Athelia psychrophila TaxID=1759441 RepID=A0A165ZZY8_9AGAM|nr:hypothetical protein FIBSPDRAFT_191751 [Fibularhizoctonia sp. CBS 109695]
MLSANLRRRFTSIVDKPPSREHSYYGPLDKLFNHYFSGEYWMVKPQAPLREELATLQGGAAEEDKEEDEEGEAGEDDGEGEEDERSEQGEEDHKSEQGEDAEMGEGYEGDQIIEDDEDDEDPSEHNHSFDSYGMPGYGPSSYPDFAICTFTGTLREDVIKYIVEVKKVGMDFKATEIQIGRYLDMVGSRGGNDVNDFVLGIIIDGSRVSFLKLTGGEIERLPSKKTYSLNGTKFQNFLERASLSYKTQWP